MRYPHKSERYVENYESTPDLVRGPWDPDSASLVLSALCNRDALSEHRELLRRLSEADISLARAIAEISGEWRAAFRKWAALAPFACAAWWLSVTALSRQLSGEVTTQADLYSPLVDIWAAAKEDQGVEVHGPLVNVRELLGSFTRGIKSTAVDLMLGAEERWQGWQSVVYPRVMVPSSLSVGFALFHEHGFSGPIDPRSAEVARVYMAAIATLSDHGPDADISGVVRSNEAQVGVRASFAGMRQALKYRGRIQLSAADTITQATALIVNPKTRSPRADRRPRKVRLEGTVRSIDLDAGEIGLKSLDGLSKTVIRYGTGGLFPLRLEPGMLLGKRAAIVVHTSELSDPPLKATLESIEEPAVEQ